ncbi:unnamed protein product [Closterium sp. Yama58-4]|nr:unnamed protein product [Closterium sp. Yama58-4]
MLGGISNEPTPSPPTVLSTAPPPSVLVLCSPDRLLGLQLLALLDSLPAHTAPPAPVCPLEESPAVEYPRVQGSSDGMLPETAAVVRTQARGAAGGAGDVRAAGDASLQEEELQQSAMQQQEQTLNPDVAALLSDIRVVVVDDVDGLVAATWHGDGCSSSSSDISSASSSSGDIRTTASGTLEAVLARIVPHSTMHHHPSARIRLAASGPLTAVGCSTALWILPFIFIRAALHPVSSPSASQSPPPPQSSSPALSAPSPSPPPLTPSSLHLLLQSLLAAGLHHHAQHLFSLSLLPPSSLHPTLHTTAQAALEARTKGGEQGRESRGEAGYDPWVHFLMGSPQAAGPPVDLGASSGMRGGDLVPCPRLPCPDSESLDLMLRAMARDGRDLFDLLRLVRLTHAAMDRAHADVDSAHTDVDSAHADADRTHLDMAEENPAHAATAHGAGSSSKHPPSRTHTLSASAYSSLIRACVNGGQVKEARRLLRDMERRGVPPTQAAVNMIAHMHFSHADPDAALSLLEHVRAAHKLPMNAALLTTYPNVRTWNALMHGYAIKGDADAAEGVLGLMQGDGGVMMGGERLGEGGGEIGMGGDGGWGEEEEEEEGSESDGTGEEGFWDGDEDVRPNTVTYTTLMAAYAAAGRSAEVWDVYREMRSLSIPPNHFTFATLVSSCAARNRPDLIESVLADVAACQQRADVALVTSVLAGVAGCCSERKEEAGRVLRWFLGEVESEGGVGEACARLILEDGLFDAQKEVAGRKGAGEAMTTTRHSGGGGATELVHLGGDTWQLDVRRLSYGGAAVALNQWLVKLQRVVLCTDTARRQVGAAAGSDGSEQWNRSETRHHRDGTSHRGEGSVQSGEADAGKVAEAGAEGEVEGGGPELLVQLAPAAAWQRVLGEGRVRQAVMQEVGRLGLPLGVGGRGQQHVGRLTAFGPDLVAWLRGPHAAAMLQLVDHDW